MTDWKDDLVAEARASTPPDGAFKVSEFMEMAGLKRERALNFLDGKVAEGVLETAKFPTQSGMAWFYWPAPKKKPAKKRKRG